MVHGYGNNISWTFQATPIFLAQQGFAYFALDLEGHGQSHDLSLRPRRPSRGARLPRFLHPGLLALGVAPVVQKLGLGLGFRLARLGLGGEEAFFFIHSGKWLFCLLCFKICGSHLELEEADLGFRKKNYKKQREEEEEGKGKRFFLKKN